MDPGIYCKKKVVVDLHESIISDEFNKFISRNNIQELKAGLEYSSVEYNSIEDTYEKWKEGMNVKALFEGDGNYYEAKIEKLIQKHSNSYAVVLFHGYNNMELVRIENLKPSDGQELIDDQIKRVELDIDNNGDYDDDDDDDEIDWTVDMPCRALYHDNDVIYEGTVLKVFPETRTAVVKMIGYDVTYNVDYANMYESIPELRIKQEQQAAVVHKNTTIPQDEQTTVHNQRIEKKYKNESISSNISQKDKTTITNEASIMSNDHKHSSSQTPDNLKECFNGIRSTVPNRNSDILQPDDENDAIACLISSNYLNGYYAGYYDCLKKFKHCQPQN